MVLDRKHFKRHCLRRHVGCVSKKYPDLIFKVDYDKKTNEMVILIEKEVVAHR